MFNYSKHWKLEIYPFTNDFIKTAAIAPTYENGISICYIIRKDHIQFNFIFRKEEGKIIRNFMQHLTEVLREMKDLFIEKERDYLRPKF
jgi:hypothetical protein